MNRADKTTPPLFISIPEYAKQLGISRIAVYKKVKKGLIPAKKVGRNYVISLQKKDKAKEDLIKSHISSSQLAKKLGISHVAVFHKIKKGQILAQKAGRNYIVDAKEFQPQPTKKQQSPLIRIDKFMTIPQVAKDLGISRIAVYKKVKAGQIKAQRIGRNFNIVPQEIFAVMPKAKRAPEKSAKTHYSIPELAKQLGMSRWALYSKVKKGEIIATKVGRSYVIRKDQINLDVPEGKNNAT